MLTSNELLILDDRYVGLQAGEAEELSPGDADLVDVGALPVVQATPWRQNQHPIPSILPEGLHQGGHADVDISAQIKTLRGVHIIQKVSVEWGERTFLPFIHNNFVWPKPHTDKHTMTPNHDKGFFSPLFYVSLCHSEPYCHLLDFYMYGILSRENGKI